MFSYEYFSRILAKYFPKCSLNIFQNARQIFSLISPFLELVPTFQSGQKLKFKKSVLRKSKKLFYYNIVFESWDFLFDNNDNIGIPLKWSVKCWWKSKVHFQCRSRVILLGAVLTKLQVVSASFTDNLPTCRTQPERH